MSELGRTPQDQRQRRPRPLDVLLLGAVGRGRHPRRHGVWRVRRQRGVRARQARHAGGHLRHDLSLPGDRPRPASPRSAEPPHPVANGGVPIAEILV